MKRLLRPLVALCVVLILSPHAEAQARPAGAIITVDTENDDNTPDDGDRQ